LPPWDPADHAVLLDVDAVREDPCDQVRGEAQKAVTPPALAALDALKKEDRAFVLVEPAEKGDRRVGVGQDLDADRDHVIAFGQRQKFALVREAAENHKPSIGSVTVSVHRTRRIKTKKAVGVFDPQPCFKTKKDRGPSELPTILWIICYRSSRLLRGSHLPPPLPGVLHYVRLK